MATHRTSRTSATLCAAFLILVSEREASAAEDQESVVEHESAVEDQVSAVDDQVSAPQAKEDDPDAGEGRFRFGVSAMGGPMTGAYQGGAGGLDLRLGHQFNNILGLYAQPVGLLGAGASIHMDGARASGLALTGAGFLLEVTPIDLFYFALGPEYLTGALGSASASASSSSAEARLETGPFFSITGRTGIAFGKVEPGGRRNAFTMGLDWRVVFAPGGPAVLPLLALGFDAF